MRPERAVGRQRLRRVDIERGGAERAVVKALQDVGFVLQPAAAGIDQDRRAHRAVAVELCEQSPIQDVPRIRRERQQTDQDIGPLQKRLELRLAVKAFDAVDLLGTSAPARDAKAETPQHFGRVRSKRAKAHDADRNRARRPLKSRRPAFLALAGSQVKLLPMMHQHVKHDIFRHATGEIADRDANQRHFRQAGIGHQRIDAGAQIENHAQVRKCRKLAGAPASRPRRSGLRRDRTPHRATARPAGRRTPRRTGSSIVRGDQFSVPPCTSKASAPLFIGFSPYDLRNCRRPYRPAFPAQNISDFLSAPGILDSSLQQTGTHPHALRHPLLSR